MKSRISIKNYNEINAHIGNHIRLRRKLFGLTQRGFSAHLGITFQQIQKYETGMNRMSASLLFFLAKILDVNPSYFFEQSKNTHDKNNGENCCYISEDDRNIQCFMRLYRKNNNIKSKKLILEVSKLILKLFK